MKEHKILKKSLSCRGYELITTNIAIFATTPLIF